MLLATSPRACFPCVRPPSCRPARDPEAPSVVGVNLPEELGIVSLLREDHAVLLLLLGLIEEFLELRRAAKFREGLVKDAVHLTPHALHVSEHVAVPRVPRDDLGSSGCEQCS